MRGYLQRHQHRRAVAGGMCGNGIMVSVDKLIRIIRIIMARRISMALATWRNKYVVVWHKRGISNNVVDPLS